VRRGASGIGRTSCGPIRARGRAIAPHTASYPAAATPGAAHLRTPRPRISTGPSGAFLELASAVRREDSRVFPPAPSLGSSRASRPAPALPAPVLALASIPAPPLVRPRADPPDTPWSCQRLRTYRRPRHLQLQAPRTEDVINSGDAICLIGPLPSRASALAQPRAATAPPTVSWAPPPAWPHAVASSIPPSTPPGSPCSKLGVQLLQQPDDSLPSSSSASTGVSRFQAFQHWWPSSSRTSCLRGVVKYYGKWTG